MKKLLSVILLLSIIVASFALSSCGEAKDNGKSTDAPATQGKAPETSGLATSGDTGTDTPDTSAPDTETDAPVVPDEPDVDLVNLFDINTAFAGTVNEKNEEKATNAYYTSDYISVAEKDVITIGPANPKQTYILHAYDDAHNVVAANIAADKLEEYASFKTYKIYTYSVPAGVTSVRVTTEAKYSDLFLITKNQKFTMNMLLDHFEYAETQEYMDTMGLYFGIDKTGPLYRKSALFMGDSICDGSHEGGFFYRGWAGRIGEVNCMEYVNAGLSSSSISTCREDHPAGRILRQLQNNKDGNYDYVIMHGGVNDAWDSAPVGEVSDGFDVSSFDTTTFAGGLEELFYYATQYYPKAALGYIINYDIKNATQTEGVNDMSAYFTVAKEICDKWNIPYLDLYWNEDVADTLKVGTNKYLYDYIHPDTLGYDQLYPFIEEWMEELTPYAAPEK